MRSTTSCLLALGVVFFQLLSYSALPSLGQSCQSAAEDGNGGCRVISKDITCRIDHLDQDLELCGMFNYLDPTFLECYDCSYSDISEENEAILRRNKIELMPIELHSFDMRGFSINISWRHPINFTVDYQITIRKDKDELLDYCICNSMNNIHVYEFDLDYPLDTNSHDNLTVEIHPKSDNGDWNFESTYRSVRWPLSCLDTDFYNSSTCGPPVLNAPVNISAVEVCGETADNLTIELRWDYDSGKFPSPSDYYIDVFSNQNVSGIDLPLYRFVANGTTAVLIQLPHRLDYNLTVKPFSNCSGVANFSSTDYGFGCGIESVIFPLKRCPPRTPPPTPFSTVPSTTTPEITDPPNANYLPYYLPYIIGGCVAIPVVMFLLIFISLLAYKIRKRKKPKFIIHKPVLAPVDFSVFLMHSPQDNSMKDIQTCVVCPLRECFDVATSGDKMCGDVVEWIELQVRQRTAVLLVFTKEFYSEWEGDEGKSQVVQAAQRLLTSAVAQELLDKYAIIVLDEDAKENFIPDNHFLKSMGVYVLGRKKSEMERLYRFVTKTKSFEHEARPSSSFGSAASSCDFASQCTLSTGVNTNYTPSSSLHDMPLKDLNHQDAHSGLKTDNSLSSENSHQPKYLHADVKLSETLLEVLNASLTPNIDDEIV